jgi:hypothetical protein
MKRAVMTLVFASAVCTLAAVPVLSQEMASSPTPVPVVRQESPQIVKAAIPPQGARPIVAPSPAAKPIEPAPQERTATTVSSSTTFDDVPNVRVEVTISYQAGQNAPVKRSASLMVASGEQGSLRSGNQVPVPSTTFVGSPVPVRPEGGSPSTPAASGPLTSYNYRSVGLNVDARRVRVAGNKAKMDLSVEFSAVDEKAADQAGRGPAYPSFPTFSQNLSLVLENGKPIVIAQTSDVVDNVERKQSVEVKATILR